MHRGNEEWRDVTPFSHKYSLAASISGAGGTTGIVYVIWCLPTGFSPPGSGQTWITNDYHFAGNNASWTPPDGVGPEPADPEAGIAQNYCEIQFSVYPTNMIEDGAAGLFNTSLIRFDVRRDKKRMTWFRTTTNFFLYTVVQTNEWVSDDYDAFGFSVLDEDNNPWDSAYGHLYGNDYPGFISNWFTNHPAYDTDYDGIIINIYGGSDPPENGAIQKLNMREWIRCEINPPPLDPSLQITLEDAQSDGTLASDPYHWHSFVGIVSNTPSGWIRCMSSVSENEITVNGLPISWGVTP